MNDESGAARDARRRMRFRLDALIAVLVATIVLAAACGSSSSSGSALPTFQTMTTEALAYAKCVRAHGIPDFPDPVVQDGATRRSITFPGSVLVPARRSSSRPTGCAGSRRASRWAPRPRSKRSWPMT